MAQQPDAALQRQVNDAFETFRRSLQDMLTAAATQEVDSTLKRLGNEGGPFRVEDVRVEVLIHELKLASSATTEPSAAPASRPQPRRPAAKQPRRGRSRSTGSVRETLLAAFDADTPQLDTGQLRERLEAAGVVTSDDNLHQQLRRLVQAGELERASRGIYRRVDQERRAA